jgi:hypothetical protein
MAVEARAPCGDCNNNNNNKLIILIAILIKIITDGNLTLTKRLIKKNCTYIISVKKKRVGLGGSRMGTKENDFKREKTMFIGMLRKKKKLEHTVIQKYFFLEIPINVKAGRVKRVPGKYNAGAAMDRVALTLIT